MTEFIEIHWTSGSIDEARKVSRYLVQERHVACAQIIPWIESVFMWKENLDTSQETKVIFKSRAEKYEKIKEVILQNCKYEVPEILRFKIEGGNREYLDWLQETTQNS